MKPAAVITARAATVYIVHVPKADEDSPSAWELVGPFCMIGCRHKHMSEKLINLLAILRDVINITIAIACRTYSLLYAKMHIFPCRPKQPHCCTVRQIVHLLAIYLQKKKKKKYTIHFKVVISRLIIFLNILYIHYFVQTFGVKFFFFFCQQVLIKLIKSDSKDVTIHQIIQKKCISSISAY